MGIQRFYNKPNRKTEGYDREVVAFFWLKKLFMKNTDVYCNLNKLIAQANHLSFKDRILTGITILYWLGCVSLALTLPIIVYALLYKNL